MPESNSVAGPEEETVEPKNFFTRLGNVYMSPGEAFEEIHRAPRLAIPIIVLILVSIIAGFYTAGIIDVNSLPASQMQQGSASGGPSPAQQQAMVRNVIKYGIVFIAPVQSILMVLIIAGFFKLLCMIATKENTFKNLFTVTLYAVTAIAIVQTAALVLTYYLKGPGSVSMVNVGSVVASSLGAILSSLFGNDVLPKFFMGLAQRVEFFSIWMIVLLAIGYSKVTQKLKTATAATWLGITYCVIAIISSAFRAVVGS